MIWGLSVIVTTLVLLGISIALGWSPILFIRSIGLLVLVSLVSWRISNRYLIRPWRDQLRYEFEQKRYMILNRYIRDLYYLSEVTTLDDWGWWGSSKSAKYVLVEKGDVS